jgi:Fic family protein
VVYILCELPRFHIKLRNTSLVVNSLTQSYLQSLPVTMSVLQTVAHLEYARGQQALFRTQSPELLKQLQTIATIESTESSSRLEGATAPRQRIEAIVLRDPTPHNRSESEIAGYRDALRMIHESAEYMSFSENTVKQIHQILQSYLPQPGGRYKATQNDIVEKDEVGRIIRVRFRPPDPVQTPIAMRDLVDNYRNAMAAENIQPLFLVALAVLDFLCIHPFPDGNGRTGRLLTLLLLYHYGFDVGQYISLERVIEESRDTYYETLEASSQGWHEAKHDSRPWITYFLGVLTKAYAEYEERVTTIRGTSGTKTDMIRRAVLRRLAPFKISDIERELPNVSRDLIRNVLNHLREEQKITLEGAGRGAHYVPVLQDRFDPNRIRGAGQGA